MMRPSLEIFVGRIETLDLDAVVNAANRALSPGTGVDGALRAAAGPELTAHTSRLAPIDEGEAIVTPGYRLKARYVIHTAAPIFRGSTDLQALSAGLARCYRNVLTLANALKLRSIAFPCLGTGVYGWPRQTACEIAIDACASLAESLSLSRIVFCCFTPADAAPYRARLG